MLQKNFKVQNVNIFKRETDKVLMFTNINSRRKLSCSNNKKRKNHTFDTFFYCVDLCCTTVFFPPLWKANLTFHVIFPLNHLRCLLLKKNSTFCGETWRTLRSSYRKKKRKHVRRTQSQNEFETRTVSAANKRHLFR